MLTARTIHSATWVAALALAGAAACSDDAPGRPIDAGPDAAPDAAPDAGLTSVATIPGTPNRDLDLLFVIDNSGSMAEEQASLAASFPAFINVLNNLEGGLPNLHLGVVSTNVGTFGVNIGGCSTASRPFGDDGNLLTNSCAGIAAPFVEDIKRADGTRMTNYSGDLATLFSCMARLGISGCGFEQPLESLRRALSLGRNPGFLRPSAMLSVIIVTDEDDCSATSGELFGDPNGTVASPLGPRTSFRCFEFGVQCDNDPNPRAFGTRTGCVPRAGAQYVSDVTPYVQFLRGLKADPRDVAVAGIIGNVDDQRTAIVGPDLDDATRPALQPSCLSASGSAAPAFRLKTFFDSFPERSTVTTICNDNLAEAVQLIASQLASASGSPCIDAALADTDPGTAGLQPLCEVTQYIVVAGMRTDPVAIPSCAAGAQPCWRFVADAQRCPLTPDNRAIAIDRVGPPPAASEVEVRCQLAP